MTPAHTIQQPVPPADAAHGSAPPAAPPRAWTPVSLGPDASGVPAPPPKGAYSPGVRAGRFVFVSGQVPRDPRTGALVGEGDVRAQTRQTLANVAGVLAAAGASLADLVSVTVHLADINDWGAFDAAYREALTEVSPPYPTRTVVGAALHGVLVEVTAVAYLRDGAERSPGDDAAGARG